MVTKTMEFSLKWRGIMERSSVSMQDVARAAGVSPQTVSRVANGSNAVRPETRQRVEAAM